MDRVVSLAISGDIDWLAMFTYAHPPLNLAKKCDAKKLFILSTIG